MVLQRFIAVPLSSFKIKGNDTKIRSNDEVNDLLSKGWEITNISSSGSGTGSVVCFVVLSKYID